MTFEREPHRSSRRSRPPTGQAPTLALQIADRQSLLPLQTDRLRQAVEMILEDEAVERAEISLAVVDDATIRRLNGEYLGRDETTDVLSFLLERDEGSLEGEVIVSAETARSTAPRFGWTADDELLLYVIHGILHLVGYDDATAGQRARMRRREAAYLARFGLRGRWEEVTAERTGPEAAATNPKETA